MPGKHWTEYIDDWRSCPMAYWVHVECDGRHWREATQFDPPAPSAAGSLGYPSLVVEWNDQQLVFSSEEQLAECIRVLGLTPLPTSRRLAAHRPGGPNGHWLSRLHASLKSPKVRGKLVDYLRSIPWPGAR